ncbi:hypothetical protein A0127_08705 [Thermococcus peptonophilus]|uniref:Class III signal peptide-containing protein n=2 Tax=Thermococcus peptonophilus TaxID=53952 RepID=A0A142CWT4_9EURY|nr:hypothetical protein A0127_08705 [Thermococcus peptonophilus]
MKAQSSLEYLFMLVAMFVLVLGTLFAYNQGVLPHTIQTGEQVSSLSLQNSAQYIIVQFNATGTWENIKSKAVSISTSNGKTTCTVQGTSYSGDYSGVINYDTNGRNLGQIYDDCMDGNDEACKVIICALGS